MVKMEAVKHVLSLLLPDAVGTGPETDEIGRERVRAASAYLDSLDLTPEEVEQLTDHAAVQRLLSDVDEARAREEAELFQELAAHLGEDETVADAWPRLPEDLKRRVQAYGQEIPAIPRSRFYALKWADALPKSGSFQVVDDPKPDTAVEAVDRAGAALEVAKVFLGVAREAWDASGLSMGRDLFIEGLGSEVPVVAQEMRRILVEAGMSVPEFLDREGNW